MNEIPPLDRNAIRPGGLWRVEVVPEAGSTNTELIARSREGAPEGTVLVTEHQTAGKGRLGRGFTTPPGVALTFSLLVRPEVPSEQLGWVSPLMGLAAVAAVRRTTGLDTRLKWPNDLLVGETKLAGILAEADFSDPSHPAIVVGMGLNVSQTRDDLPVETATSLRAEGAHTLRETLLVAVLEEFERRYTTWKFADEYRDVCVTIGRRVRVHLPGGTFLDGTATGVDDQARLLVAGRALSAGDVVHVRPGE